MARASTTGAAGGATGSARRPTPAVNARLVELGYRVQQRGEQLRYCRSQSVTGTAFPITICLTEAQIAERERAVQRSTDAMNRQPAARCVPNMCKP